jgi:pentose-5-phosphate-3-epimerase
MKDAGAHMFTFHVEAVESEEETHNLIKEIRAAGANPQPSNPEP